MSKLHRFSSVMEQSTKGVDSVLKDSQFPWDLPASVFDLPFFPLTKADLEYALSEVVAGRGQTDCTECKDLLSRKGVLDLL